MRGPTPKTDTVPPSVNKYLLPGERQVISVHEHPAVLIKPILLVLVAFPIAAWLTIAFAHGNAVALWVIWGLWGLLLARLAVKILDWSLNYFVITSKRLLLLEGVIIRKANMLPLDKVVDLRYERTSLARLLGYGEFFVETPGPDIPLNHVNYLPYPDQLYLEVCGLMFKEESQEGKDDSRRLEAELARLSGAMEGELARLSGTMQGELGNLSEVLQRLLRWLDQRDR
jgi:uncharacterized membrane protein YdbT with pleckstrin-like domain